MQRLGTPPACAAPALRPPMHHPPTHPPPRNHPATAPRLRLRCQPADGAVCGKPRVSAVCGKPRVTTQHTRARPPTNPGTASHLHLRQPADGAVLGKPEVIIHHHVGRRAAAERGAAAARVAPRLARLLRGAGRAGAGGACRWVGRGAGAGVGRGPGQAASRGEQPARARSGTRDPMGCCCCCRARHVSAPCPPGWCGCSQTARRASLPRSTRSARCGAASVGARQEGAGGARDAEAAPAARVPGPR